MIAAWGLSLPLTDAPPPLCSFSFPEVRVTGVDREALGVMRTEEALALAQENEVDLVLVAPDAEPPVCRMVEYSKYKYELEKAKKDASKKQRESK